MEWTTRSHLHLDRTASAWLIRRFIDADATFVFVDGPEEIAAPQRAFGVPGVGIGALDADGTCFAKLLRAHHLLDDGALARIECALAAGVQHALGRPRSEPDDDVHFLGRALDSIGLGLGIVYEDDTQHLDAAIPLYDALYCALQVRPATLADLPTTPGERMAHLRALVRLPHPS